MLMFLLEEQTQKEVTRIFDHLTELLGIELFQKLFEVILTDNGHEFQDRQSLEYSKNGEVRTRIYYCDPNRSDQKGALEKNHEKSIIYGIKEDQEYTFDDVSDTMSKRQVGVLVVMVACFGVLIYG